MKRFGLFGALLAALALCATALVAVSAGAEETVWLCGERTIPRAKECLILSENLETLTLEDMGIPARVECEPGAVLNEGWVGPGREDEVTNVEFLNIDLREAGRPGCDAPQGNTAENLEGRLVENQCLLVEDIKPLNLPWHTELVLEGSAALDLILPASGSTELERQPGYVTKCEGLLGARVEDRCFGQPEHSVLVLVENLRLEGSEFPLVDIIFDKEPPEGEREFATCKANIVGEHAKDGLVFGAVLLAAFLGGNPASLEWSES